MILAVFGIIAFVYECARKSSFSISQRILASAIIAIIFSVWCFYCITVNGTDDTTYSSYWLSFATWLGAAYAVCWLIRECEGKIDLASLTFYLTLVCSSQCILALIIDHSLPFKQAVDAIFVQGQEFYHQINRMYGIGAALDTAGVRFSVVLVLMAHQMSSNGSVIDNKGLTLFYFISFALIVVVGSMIARTTWVGAILGISYLAISYLKINKGFISSRQVSFWLIMGGITALTILVSVWLYNHNPDFRHNLRFGFEGFFNWAETGVFRTDSTDKLNRIMWVWPKDMRSWIIGTGLFADWVYGTDIGYCRFVLYCGLIGLVIFSIFFIFNGLSVIHLFPGTKYLALVLIALTFIIWLKVSTDIFFIYALLFSTASLQEKLCASSTT
ncbi:MAG: hypothetical protein IKW89_13005 [Bacteroidales bacterium]|nr:hypothetical protein [Bacteroidales bacterium]